MSYLTILYFCRVVYNSTNMGSYYSHDESMLHKQSHAKFKKKYDTEDNPDNKIVDI